MSDEQIHGQRDLDAPNAANATPATRDLSGQWAAGRLDYDD
jgi:hypothetical protein